jgi:hypothetical protein
VHRIIAIGDLHGDFADWRDIVRDAKLVDDSGRWTGGDAVLVQVGDAVDRGNDSLKIIQDLMRLQGEARHAQGQVIALVGNHEAMNVTGDLRYVSAGDYAALSDSRSAERREAVYTANKTAIEMSYRQRDPKMTDDAIKQAWIAATPLGYVEHLIAWRPDGKIGRWIVSNPAVALVDGNLFVHGGISPTYVNMSIAEINHQVAAALTALSTDPKAIINDPVGPLWYRGLAIPHPEGAAGPSTASPSTASPPTEASEATDDTSPPEPPVEDQLAALLAAYGAKRIIIGHTPVLSGIDVLYGGRLIRIDTGITTVYGGAVAYLEILDGTPVPHIVQRAPSPPKQGVQ